MDDTSPGNGHPDHAAPGNGHPGNRHFGHTRPGDADLDRPASPPRPSGRPGPGTRKQLGLVNGAIEAIGARATGRKRLGVFATIGRAKRLFRGWLIYSATMMPFGELSRTDTELIILRVAHGRGADYERDHHRVIGKRAGLTEAEIAAVDRRDHGFTGRRGAMIAVADRLVAKRDVDDATWAELSRHLSDRECVALVQLITHYDGLATALHVLGTPADEKR